MILFSLYAFISLKIDQLVDIMMNMGHKFISGNPGKMKPLISGIPGNDWFPQLTVTYIYIYLSIAYIRYISIAYIVTSISSFFTSTTIGLYLLSPSPSPSPFPSPISLLSISISLYLSLFYLSLYLIDIYIDIDI